MDEEEHSEENNALFEIISKIFKEEGMIEDKDSIGYFKRLFELKKPLSIFPEDSIKKLYRLLKFRIFQKGDTIIDESEKFPDVHFILKGTVIYSRPKKEMDLKKEIKIWNLYIRKEKKVSEKLALRAKERKLFPGDSFGDMKKYINTRYESLNYYALEDCEILILPTVPAFKIIDELNLNPIYVEMKNFLTKNFYGFNSLSHVLKDIISSCFTLKEFIKGKLLVEEDKEGKSLFLIKEGTCRMYLKKNTLALSYKFADKFDKNTIDNSQKNKQLGSENGSNGSIGSKSRALPNQIIEEIKEIKENEENEENEELFEDDDNLKDTILKGNMGLMSPSLNTFQIKNLSPGQWVGEELMNHPKSPYRYSVVAINKVTAMEIKINELVSKFPRDIINRLQQLGIENEEWIKSRIKAISITSKEISNKNPLVEKIDDDFSIYFKKYPKINSRSLTKIRMQAISNKSLLNKNLYYSERRLIKIKNDQNDQNDHNNQNDKNTNNSELSLIRFNSNSKSNLNLHRNVGIIPSLSNESKLDPRKNNIRETPVLRNIETKQKLNLNLNLNFNQKLPDINLNLNQNDKQSNGDNVKQIIAPTGITYRKFTGKLFSVFRPNQNLALNKFQNYNSNTTNTNPNRGITKNLYFKFEDLVKTKSNELKTKFLFDSLRRKDTPQLYDEWQKILSNNIDL